MAQHLNQRIFVSEPQTFRTKCFCRFNAVVADKIRGLDAFIPCIRAHFGVHGGGVILTQFAHIAHHKNTRCGHSGEHINGGFHAVGVGIISIVNQSCIFNALLDIQTAFDIAEIFQAV